MTKNVFLPGVLFIALITFAGFYLGHYIDFSNRFDKGILIKADGEEIKIEKGSLAPVITDWNNDGKKDLIVGQFLMGKIRLYLNYGDDKAPLFKEYSYIKAGDREISLTYG